MTVLLILENFGIASLGCLIGTLASSPTTFNRRTKRLRDGYLSHRFPKVAVNYIYLLLLTLASTVVNCSIAWRLFAEAIAMSVVIGLTGGLAIKRFLPETPNLSKMMGSSDNG